jgi:polysaccharide export outer membrane protein
MANRIVAASVVILTALLAACTGIPTDGPSTGAITDAGVANLRIEQLDLASVEGLGSSEGAGEAIVYAPTASTPRGLIQEGDLVTVIMFEGLPDGVFGTSASGGSQFKGLLVREDGSLQIPYIGRIQAAGRDTEEVRREILSSVRRFAARPDAVVAIESRNAGNVSVTGAVTTPGRFVVGADVLTLQDALSRAGAPFNKPYTARIVVRRESGEITGNLADIMAGPPIRLDGNTDIIVSLRPATFQALGAVRSAGPHEITYADVSLLDALGLVGGLDPSRANPQGVFVFRAPPPASEDRRPIIYQLNMAEPDAFAIATGFQVRAGDTLYVTEAPVAQWTKVLAAIQGTIGLGATGATLGNLVN